MKAALATGTVDTCIDEHVQVVDNWPKPTLATAIDGKTGKRVSDLMVMEREKDANGNRYMIIKVLACALAPGDARLLKGKTDRMQLPAWGRPYVIGSDVCGIVTEVCEWEGYFKVGDKVIARFDEPQPHGMCAEYACVQTSLSEKCPYKNLPAIHACTLPASAAAAKLVAETYIIHPGSRVLLLGASGGLGTFLCQYIKKKQGASFLAATSTQADLVKSLGVDRVIDYRTENWWELEDEFGRHNDDDDDTEDNNGTLPFDVVIDLVNGDNWQRGACSGTRVLKRKAQYLQLLTGVATEIDMSWGVISMISFAGGLVGRMLRSKMFPNYYPRYIAPQGLALKPGDLKAVLEDVAETSDGKENIRVVLDPGSPFPFDTAGVRQAMKLQRSTHAHGKVVVEIAQEE